MDIANVLGFLGASILLALMPGPDNIYVLTESLINGKQKGIAISLGLSFGVLVHTLAASMGLSLILQQSSQAFTIVKLLGAGYLFYLAYQSWQDTSQPSIGLQREKRFTALGKEVSKGFMMNVLNPKVALFFIAFLPQFVTTDGWPYVQQMIVLGGIFMVQAFIVMSTIAMFAGMLKPYLDYPRFWNITRWSKIGVLAGLGILLLVSKR